MLHHLRRERLKQQRIHRPRFPDGVVNIVSRQVQARILDGASRRMMALSRQTAQPQMPDACAWRLFGGQYVF